ncbi:hypothetical protein Gotur_004208, partial [Gossypium turneri]
MDMSSFPKMLQFKQKEVPHPQLLRWAEWFSKFSFNVKHIKEKNNVIADILTRPPEIFMFQPSSSSKGKGKKKIPQNPPSPFSIPCQPNSHLDHPPEVLSLHPEYPFIHPLKFQFGEFSEELKWMFWYLTHLFHIGIEFFILDLQHFLTMAIQDEISPEMKNLVNFFKWFYPLEQWVDMIMFEFLKNTRVQWILIIFYKPQYFMQNGPATQLGAFPSAWIHKTHFLEVSLNPYDFK